MASAIFCFGVHHQEFLEFPYLQWIEARSLFWVVNWRIKIWIGIAAILPFTGALIGLHRAGSLRTPRQTAALCCEPVGGPAPNARRRCPAQT